MTETKRELPELKGNLKLLAIFAFVFLALGLAGESDYRTCLEYPALEMCG